MIFIQTITGHIAIHGIKWGECFQTLRKFLTTVYSFSFFSFSCFIQKSILPPYVIFLVPCLTVKKKTCLHVEASGLVVVKITRHTSILFKKHPEVWEKLIVTLGLETWLGQALSDGYLYPINVIIACTQNKQTKKIAKGKTTGKKPLSILV